MAGKIKARARARNSQHTQREWSTENVLFFQGGGSYGDNLHALSGKQHEKTNEHSIVFSVVSLTQTSTLIPKVHHSETKFYKHFCGWVSPKNRPFGQLISSKLNKIKTIGERRRNFFLLGACAFSEFLLSTSVDRWRDLSVIPWYLLAPSPTLIIRTYSSHVLNQPFGIFVETTEDKRKDDHWSFSESVSSFPLSFFHSCPS